MKKDNFLEEYFDDNPEKARKIAESIVLDQKEKQQERDKLREHGPTLWLPPNPDWAYNRGIPYWVIVAAFIVVPAIILLLIILKVV